MSAIDINKNNFQDEVMNSEKPVLLDFWAPWCGPCRRVVPIVEEIAKERPDIKVGKVNVDLESELASQFGVMSIPTLVVIKDGENRIETGRKKVGAILGDYVEIGCNSVLNPGTVIGRDSNVYPLSCVRGVVPANSIYKTGGVIAPKE